MSNKNMFRPILGYEAYQKITTWVDIAPGEISGVGVVKLEADEEGNNILRVDDVFLLKQDCTPSHTELDQGAIADLVGEWIEAKNGYDEMPIFWWHSHVNMGMFWSSVDDECVKSIGGDRLLLSTVFNKKGQTKTRVDFFDKPSFLPGHNFKRQVKFDDLNLEIERPEVDVVQHYFDNYLNGFEYKDPSDYENTLDFLRDFLKHSELEEFLEVEEVVPQELIDFCQREYSQKVTNKMVTAGFKGQHHVIQQTNLIGSGTEAWREWVKDEKKPEQRQRPQSPYGDNDGDWGLEKFHSVFGKD